MPPRDEQDYEQRRQQIIDGALEVFSAKGFDGASNKEIAEAAKIGSPGLIYHYFKDKVDLLHQVILTRMPLIELIDTTSTRLDLDLPPEVLLPELISNITRVLQSELTIALMKVVLSESMRNRRVAQMVNEVGPGRALRLMAGYLERQMDAGRLRRTDPHVAARILVGPIIAYSLTRFVFEQPEAEGIDPELMVRETVMSFLQSMAP
ncbi:MAG: TetR/AcrR family transcriptional regulator [Chloroflexales bacterium]|nr:TetR/AcrR family transcriptional regulator [Chloroflexales bacterium]